MPGFLSAYSKVTRLNIDPEGKWWIDVRDTITRRDAALAQAALVKPVVHYDGPTSETTSNVDTGAYQMELVLAAIVDWNLTDEEDALLPLSPPEAKRESINRLPNEVFNIVSGHAQGVPRPSDASFPAEPVARPNGRRPTSA